MKNTSNKLTAWEIKLAVAFSVVILADMEKRMLAASPLKPFVWKNLNLAMTFSLWNIPMEEASSFINFANSFHPTINFSRAMSSERGVLLYTEVFKRPRLSTLRILNSQTHFKPTETFQYTQYHPAIHSIQKRVLSKENDYFFNLRTNSVKENFYKYKRDLEQRLCNRGYPPTFVPKFLTEVQFSERTETLRNKTKKEKKKFDLLISKSSLLFLFCRKKI